MLVQLHLQLVDIGHKVIGVDINTNKVDQINKGYHPVESEGLI